MAPDTPSYAAVPDATIAQDLQSWLQQWEEGVSESENDSDGDSKDKLKAAGLVSEDEMFMRRAHLLEKLQALYHSQFVRLQRYVCRPSDAVDGDAVLLVLSVGVLILVY